MIESSREVAGDGLRWPVTISANTTATLYVLAKEVLSLTEGGRALDPIEHLQHYSGSKLKERS